MPISRVLTPVTRPRPLSDAPPATQLRAPSSRHASVPNDRSTRRPSLFPNVPGPLPLPLSASQSPHRPSPSSVSGSGFARPPSATGLPPPRRRNDPFVPVVSSTPRRIPSAPGITMTEETLFHKDGKWADPIPGLNRTPPREFTNVTLRKIVEANGSVHHERIWKERKITPDGDVLDEFKMLKAGIISDTDAGSLYRPDIAPGAGREPNLASWWNGRGGGPTYTQAPPRPRNPSPSPTARSSSNSASSLYRPMLTRAPPPPPTVTPRFPSTSSRSPMSTKFTSRGMSPSQHFNSGYVPMGMGMGMGGSGSSSNGSETLMPAYSRIRRDSTSSNSGQVGVGRSGGYPGRPMSRGYGR